MRHVHQTAAAVIFSILTAVFTIVGAGMPHAIAAGPMTFYSQPAGGSRAVELSGYHPVIATTFTAADSGFMTFVFASVMAINCTRPVALSLMSTDPATGLPFAVLATAPETPADRNFYGFGAVAWSFNSPIVLQQGTTYALRFTLTPADSCATDFEGGGDVTPSNIYYPTVDGWALLTANDMTLAVYGEGARAAGVMQMLPTGEVLAAGSDITRNIVMFGGTVISAAGAPTRLQAELRPLDQPFSGANDDGMFTGDAVASGAAANVTTSTLPDGPYHWRVRAIDSGGKVSEWHTSGAEPDADFFIHAAKNPPGVIYAQSRQTSVPVYIGVPNRMIAHTFRAEQTGVLTSLTLQVKYAECRRAIVASVWSVSPDNSAGVPETFLAGSLNSPSDNDLGLDSGSLYNFYPITWQFAPTLTLREGTIYAVRLFWPDYSSPCSAVFMGGGNMTSGRIYNLTPDGPRFVSYDDWTMTVNGVPPETPPVLTTISAPGFDDGMEPNNGSPETQRTFTIIYTDAENQAPAFLRAVVQDAAGDAPIIVALSPDVSAPAVLHDGNYANGEQFSATATFPAGSYSYYIETSDGTDAVRFPAGTDTFKLQSGYSSVAFLPGLEASRLYTTSTYMGATIENRLWEPLTNTNVRGLYMNSDGTSINPNIYTRDAVDRIYGVFGDIYSGFTDSMQKLVTAKAINEFEVLPYDWRLELDDVLSGGAVLGTTGAGANLSYTKLSASPYIISEIERLAKGSATGKVTLIGHSNGGLLAKRLVTALANKGEANLIDKIILVAVPQTGTPSAVAALLHGHDQELGGGFVMSRQTARTLAENMPAAYNLIPDQKYFTDVSTPVITFDSQSSVTQQFRNTYGNSITGRSALQQFLLGADGRAKPAANDTDDPNVLNSALLTRASTVQDDLDNWSTPLGVQVIQIAGWGVSTLSGIYYTEKDNPACTGSSTCTPKKVLDYAPNVVVDGDGTVVVPSALAIGANEEEYFVNIEDFNNKNKFLGRSANVAHKDILAIPQLKEFISNKIQENPTVPQYISNEIPPSTGARLNFSAHSPVSLDLYDTAGNHTGPSANPNGDVQLIDEQIPNSYYMEFGEGKYAGADSDSGATVKLVGQSLGTFTLNITETSGDTAVGSATFADVPVAAGSVITIAAAPLTTQPTLAIDIDGNGTVDVSATQNSIATPLTSLKLLRAIVAAMGLPKGITQGALAKIDAATDSLNRNNLKTAANQLNALINYIAAQTDKYIPAKSATALIGIIEKIQAKMVK